MSSLDKLQKQAVAGFREAFGEEPALVVAAPGRVNLIGEHTDYNDGFVLPVAIDRQIVIAAARRADRQVRLRSLDLGSTSDYSLDRIDHAVRGPGGSGQAWSNYERGVTLMLQQAGYQLGGVNAAIIGDVPIGAGLSSSAAVEVATAYMFQQLCDLELSRVKLAVLCQKAENEFVGMRCGIMDQYISSLGKRDHALLIDCRSLDYELVPIPGGVAIIVCDTKVQRGLVDSEYNARRRECETGARLLGVPALRDVTPEMFERRAQELPDVTRRRCRHVVYENQRVLDSVIALRAGDLQTFGKLMYDSHVSLRDDYEVSCRNLDVMVEAARKVDGVYGARMTGAGFGGCTVNLVDASRADAFRRQVAAEYTRRTGLLPSIYVCTAEDGARALL